MVQIILSIMPLGLRKLIDFLPFWLRSHIWHDDFTSRTLVPFQIWIFQYYKTTQEVDQEINPSLDRQTFARMTIDKFHFRSQ